tara:strand:+ start:59 stop:1525 length:1467 start_codon:yes stop_codon:yes gene_type:complete
MMKLVINFPLIIGFCGLCSSCLGQLNFSPDITFANSNQIEGVLGVGDFDSDGDLDIFSAKEGTGGTTTNRLLYVFENDGGVSISSSSYSFDPGYVGPMAGQDIEHYYGMDSGDFNQDGLLDFVVHGVWQGNGNLDQLCVLINNGDLSFEMPIETYGFISSWDNSVVPFIEDFDLDGDGDVLAYVNGVWKAFENQGDYSNYGWDPAYTSVMGASSGQLELKDLNQDGLSDLIVGGSGGLYLFPRNLDGDINEQWVSLSNESVACFQTGDWNNDEVDDIIFWDAEQSALMIVEHFSGDVFYDPTPISGAEDFVCTNDRSDPFLLHDFNNDGWPDLLSKNETSGSITIYLNENGELGSQNFLSSDITVHHTAIGDLDGDEIVDVICSADSQRIVYFKNLSSLAGCIDTSACNYNISAFEDDGSCEYPLYPYDCDNNCLNDADENGICDEFEQAAPYNPDSNGDGIINLLDLLEIFPLFGQPIETVPCISPE